MQIRRSQPSRLLRCAPLVFLALIPRSVASSVTPEELAGRRQRVAQAIGTRALLVLFAPQPSHRNGDVDWPFRQDDNLYYLTGVEAPDTTLVLMPGESEHKEVLFAQDANPLQEVWNGKRKGHAELAAESGISEVVPAGKFGDFLSAALAGRHWGESELYRYFRRPAMPRYLEAVGAGEAEVWLALGRRPREGEPLGRELGLAAQLSRVYPEIKIRDASRLLVSLREVKSPSEIALLTRAIEITEEAHKAAMRRAPEATWEYQIEATIEFTFRNQGACCWGFPSIVGAGENATTLHYQTNNDPIPREGLILIDIGAEVEHYTADITRTFPADGTFSEEQRHIYEAVLAASQAALPLLRPGNYLADAHIKAQDVLGDELLKLGLVAQGVAEQVKLYFMHGVGHPIGLQVHDVFDRARRLEPGMVVTLEPGLYVRPRDVRASAVFGSLSASEKATVSVALDRYAGLGVRIEDDILITESDPILLSNESPRTVEEIERFMAGRP